MSDQSPTYAQIAQMLKDRAADFTPYILGVQPTSRTASEHRFYPKGGFILHLTGRKAGRFTDFADAHITSGDMVDLIRSKLGLNQHEAIEYAKNWLGITNTTTAISLPTAEERRIADEKNIADEREANKKRLRTASWLWNQARDPLHEVISYLGNRGIEMNELPSCIRARRLDEEALEKMDLLSDGVTGEVWSAVFGATDINGNVRAVQQVLIHNGQKITRSFPRARNPKRTNGIMEGAAVKLAMPEDVLALAEGPETGLSFLVATGIPTWVVLGKSNFTRVDIPKSVKKLLICVDLEDHGNGIASALKAASYWQTKGLEVELVIPDLEDGDFNDVLQQQGAASINRSVDQSLKSPAGMATRAVIMCKDPRDGLLLWQATGYTVMTTVKDINVNLHGPDVTPEELIILMTDGLTADEEVLRKRYPGTEIRTLSVRSTTLRIAVPRAPDMAELVRFATPLGKTPLFGLSKLIGRHDDPVILCPNAGDAARAQKVSARVVIAWMADAAQSDFSPLSDRDVVIAATHSPKGQREAADIAAHALAAGASAVRIVEWPLFAPQGENHAILHRKLPADYGLGQALDDGWENRERFDDILELAVAI